MLACNLPNVTVLQIQTEVMALSLFAAAVVIGDYLQSTIATKSRALGFDVRKLPPPASSATVKSRFTPIGEDKLPHIDYKGAMVKTDELELLKRRECSRQHRVVICDRKL